MVNVINTENNRLEREEEGEGERERQIEEQREP